MVIPGDNCNPEPRICEIGTNVRTGKCTSNSYTSHGLHYSHVCGMIRAYQFRTPDAFAHGRQQTLLNINSNYVDGVSLTHGVRPSRKHIWTFAAGTRILVCMCVCVCGGGGGGGNWKKD